ncbi:MAG: hypothetical protein F6K26_27445 [Moorea sp. SIO2I5]|nr:hypothetical protein [Moorena sp. SIO2I5]
MQQGNRGGSAAKGGSPHEQLAWFPPLALCIKTMNRGLINDSIFHEFIGIKAL